MWVDFLYMHIPREKVLNNLTRSKYVFEMNLKRKYNFGQKIRNTRIEVIISLLRRCVERWAVVENTSTNTNFDTYYEMIIGHSILNTSVR